MKVQKFLIYIFVFLLTIFAVIFPAQTETTNNSDTTVPNPIEVIPETPNIPDTPSTPETPDTPNNPETPNTPTNPETPETPDTPNTPDTPTNPETPDTPNTPDTPTNPETPDTPNTPNNNNDRPSNNNDRPSNNNDRPSNNNNRPNNNNDRPNNNNKPDKPNNNRPNDTDTNNPDKPNDTDTNNPDKPNDTDTNNPDKPNDTDTNNPDKPNDTDTNNPDKPNDTDTNNPDKPNDTDTNKPDKPNDTDTNKPDKPSDNSIDNPSDNSSENNQEAPEKIIKDIEQEIKTQVPEPVQPIDRVGYEVKVEQAPTTDAVQLQEEFQATQIQNYTGMKFYGDVPSADEIESRLSEIYQNTEKKAALIYISALEDELNSFVLTPQINASDKSNNKQLENDKLDRATKITVSVSRQELLKTVERFTNAVSDEFRVGDRDFLKDSQKLYSWLIAPLEDKLIENRIDTLIFNMDAGLRSFPLAALYDGKQYLIERYALAIIPSFGLTDTSYEDVRKSSILAMGASQFINQTPLPAVPLELTTITDKPWKGETFINEQFTVENFITQNQNRNNKIIHLGTHAEFLPGTPDESYIQFYDRQLTMSELRLLSDKLGWTSSTNSPVDLLVLSACRTALGDDRAELGFAGLAVQAGVKSVLASLWYVSDVGTLGLMSDFYQKFSQIPVKAEALRQAQLAMLRGEVRVDGDRLSLGGGREIELPENSPKGSFELSHPYYWSAFMLVGNWT